MPEVMEQRRSKSLFDDIFRLQSTAPEDDIDPEDVENAGKAQLVSAALDDDETEHLATPSELRKQTAIIPEEPRYKGRRTSRKDLYSDEENDEQDEQSSHGSDSEDGMDFNDDDDDEEEEAGDDETDGDDDDDEEEEESDSGVDNSKLGNQETEEDGVKILPEDKSEDREKGKAVVQQLGLWDDLIKTRIVLQKLVAASNRLPQHDTWPEFWENPDFRREAKDVHSSVRKVVSALLDVQTSLASSVATDSKEKEEHDSDEEITSESEDGDNEERNSNMNGGDARGGGEDEEEEGSEDDDDDDEMKDNDDDEGESSQRQKSSTNATEESGQSGLKRKLDVDTVEETLAKRHADFRSFRNDTLSKWDEKTRLVHGKVKSKNFAAFEVSVLKQIEQVLVNRERLVRRLHQKRSDYRILGRPLTEGGNSNDGEVTVEDDEEEVELKLKQRSKTEASVEPEIIDDTDFYHVCLRDLIEMKQNEETDPVLANKQWLEIQRLRNKQKQKVDTKASKGRKIRYNVKEKLKNFMTTYDKSVWSNEQKDDLFKALFGGKQSQNGISKSNGETKQEEVPFNLGI